MRIINVISIENNLISNIEPFPIHEEQFFKEIIEKAESDFENKAISIGGNPDEIEDCLMDGYYECPTTNRTVSIVWTYID